MMYNEAESEMITAEIHVNITVFQRDRIEYQHMPKTDKQQDHKVIGGRVSVCERELVRVFTAAQNVGNACTVCMYVTLHGFPYQLRSNRVCCNYYFLANLCLVL